MNHSTSADHMIDNAATASQNVSLLDDPVTREAINLNIIQPLINAHDDLITALYAIAFARPAGATPKMVKGELIEFAERKALEALHKAGAL